MYFPLNLLFNLYSSHFILGSMPCNTSKFRDSTSYLLPSCSVWLPHLPGYAMHSFSCVTRKTTLFCCICKGAEAATYRCLLGEPAESSSGDAEVLSLSPSSRA